jgi:hypothetical protein
LSTLFVAGRVSVAGAWQVRGSIQLPEEHVNFSWIFSTSGSLFCQLLCIFILDNFGHGSIRE